MTILSIGQMTALDVDVLKYIDIAASVGCQKVSLMVQPPGQGSHWPVTNHENLQAVKQKLADSGLGVLNAECFMLVPGVDVAVYQPALDLAAELHALGVTALIYDPDIERASNNLSRLCEMAQAKGLRVNIEFMPLAPVCRSLTETVSFIKGLGQPNLGVAIDLLHLIRSGGTVEEVAATPPELISYVQICDSADTSVNSNYGEEAAANRLPPGKGGFPVTAFLQALPAGTPVEIEVPMPGEGSNDSSGKQSAKVRVQAIAAATKNELEKAGL